MQELTQHPTAIHPGQTLGNYSLLREAGRGGMSVVYEATDDRMGRRVALKVLAAPAHFSPTQREEMIARLRREARAIARLSHPNVVHVYDVGEQAGAHYIVMEYLDGQTLRERLDAEPLSPEEAADILTQVAAALDAVHAQAVLHRDIKPSNVMLLPDGSVRLMDFGVARRADDTLVTQAGMMVGSPAYMAPELVNGGEASVASDLWSLGVLLYQMLAGHPPFASKNIPAVLYQVTHEDPEPLRRAPAVAQRVMNRALDKNPAKRFTSGREMADAFRAALAEPTSPTFARPPVRRRPPPRWLGPALAGLFLVPATLGASLLGRWLAVHHRVGKAPAVQTAAQRPVRQEHPSVSVSVPPLSSKTPPIVRVAESRQEKKALPTAPLRRHKPRRRITAPAPIPVRRVAHSVAAAPIQRAHPQRRYVPTPHAVAALHPSRRPLQETDFRPAATRTSSGLEGTWHGWQGIHGKDPVVLKITHHLGSAFDGVMTVRTPERAIVRVALTGHVSPRGQVTMREQRILSSTKPNAWDLGSKTGQIGPNGQMSGQDHDVRGRTARWSFSR